jgi:hypothetical protein
MRTLRYFFVLIALMFWQGGFTFYVSVVVPVGTEVLGSALRQGFITREVTFWLNIAGAIALVVLLLDLMVCRDPVRLRARLRWGLWLFMALCQGLLFWLHTCLDRLMQVRGRIVLDPEAFYPIHRLYLWTHTLQCTAGLVFVGLMLSAWQREVRDRTLVVEEKDREKRMCAQKSSAIDRLGVAQSPTQSRRNIVN